MLGPGKRLGPYEIVSRVGAGGMGEVFKARDTRLDRSVAVKVLPSEFARNAEVKLRFEREAKTISQFAHPHICTLYDVGSEDGVDYLVMEYLEGETLAERLERGPLPVDQVLRYGIEIADALERAHKAAIVHRDLKPGNVMLTRGGAKLLDFGLAKEAGIAGPISPSVTTEKKTLTEEGTIVGTFQYMAPEQLEGRDVDARTDIFALGALLYEMATAHPAFPARSKASLIAAILTTQPPSIRESQPESPPALDRIIRTCLQKEPDERFQSVHDVRLALQWIREGEPAAATRSTRRVAPIAVAGVLFAIMAVVAVSLFVQERFRRPERRVVRTSIVPPSSLALANNAPPELSPDGTQIVFGTSSGAAPAAEQQLWIRALDSTAARPLAGAENGSYPFWSPDGRQIAFFADGKLKKVGIAGGPPTVICDAPSARGGSWSGDTILFAGRYTPIMRVAASGGTPVAVTRLVKGSEVSHRWPRFLPDGKHFLYVASPTGAESIRTRIAVGNLSGTMQRPIAPGTSQPLYYDGFLLTVRQGALIAQRFDAEALELRGDPVVLSERGISMFAPLTRSHFTVSSSGTLLYQTGKLEEETQLVWYDRTGKELGVVGTPQPYSSLSLSPDDNGIAASASTAGSSVWIYDRNRGVRTRLTAGEYDIWPVWSRDGRSVAFSSRRPGHLDIYVRDVATGTERPAARSEMDKIATSWSPDGRIIFYDALGLASGTDIRYVTVADGKSHPYAATQFMESSAKMSPDGKWIAFQSNESGQPEIYVAPFPPTGAKWTVSQNGGLTPRWRGDGRELFFIQPSTQTVMAVPVDLGATPDIGKPVPLFRVRVSSGVVPWDVSADGQRIIAAAQRGPEPMREPMTVVQNFDVALRKAAPDE
ncbi:MAG TPA: protein kinase [Thermoanaerobaculia bacterium]|jgi:serine/threonine protein kinase/Tol biopolymer transport system component